MDTLIQILLFGGFMFLMMRFGCGSHMMGRGHGKGHAKDKHAGGCCGGKKDKHDEVSTEASPGASTGNEQSKWVQPEEDRDPVCSKMVSKGVAKTSVHDGLAYYFCSTDCRDAFEASPEQYVGREEETATPRLEQRPAEGGGHG